MNEIIVNDMIIHVFMLAFSCTVLIVFANNYIRYLGQKKQIKILFKKMEEQKSIVNQQTILVEHLEKTVTWFSKPENTISHCPQGSTCETAQNICTMAKATLERMDKNENS